MARHRIRVNSSENGSNGRCRRVISTFRPTYGISRITSASIPTLSGYFFEWTPMDSSIHRFRLSQQLTPDPPPQSQGEGGESLDPRNSIPPKRTISCQRCRKLKKKCSKTHPSCTLCTHAQVPCSFLEASKTLSLSLSDIQDLQARVVWLSSYVNNALPLTSPVESFATGADLTASTSHSYDGSSPAIGNEDLIPGQPHPLSLRTQIPILHNTGENTIQATTPIQGLPSPLDQLEAPITNANSSISYQASSIFNIHSAGRESITRVPDEAAGRQFVDAYFRHIHRAYPFMDRAEVSKKVDMMGDLLTDRMENMSTNVYIVMAIGCTTLQRMGQVSDEISAKFQISSWKILEECMSKRDIDSIETLLLLGLHSLFDPKGLSPWVITGLLSRQIMSLGLSRETSPNQGISLAQSEKRNRLFWSAYTLDRMVSSSMGLPFGINDENMNVPLPGVTLDEYATSERQYYTVTLQVNRHVIALRQLEEQILQKIHLSNSYSTTSLTQADRRIITQRLRTQIENWYTQGCLVTPMERDQIPFHNTIPWLNYRYQNLLLLLYTPSHFNSPISLDHAQELRRCVQKYIQLSTILFQQRHLPLNWVTLCRFVALCPVLYYCYVDSGSANGSGIPNLGSKEEVNMCADILEAFPERWTEARRAARVIRRLANAFGASSSAEMDPSCMLPHRAGEGVGVAGGNGIKEEVTDLVRDMLGESSIYHQSIEAAGFLARERSERGVFEQLRNDAPMRALNGWNAAEGEWNGGEDLSMGFI
ncbi:hypothetical protein HYFRA_00004429 [Hymenoscyphus fraxineus]|uniref:Zn(2)-C6 fungal-type domain-containing protein n=1 Tax=Hymenoscyphus fraxineus TaxID=746836 RepID=A0A9N9PSU3_9HELO|nr:hypothetical protein HYFRA_00004429 [Hymenoscyphus fraxineus]